MHANLIAMLLCAAALSSASAEGVLSYSIPSFNTTTTTFDLLVSTNSSVFGFDPGHPHDPKFDHNEGFLLLDPRIEVWRAGADGKPPFQASFNTSFMVRGVKPIAFVFLESIPLGGSLRGNGNVTLIEYANVSGIAEVQVCPVMSYLIPDGLNVTVTPQKPAGGELAVWIEYGAAAQSLAVYVGNGGSRTKPSKPVVNTTVILFVWPKTSTNQTLAYTGFFAGKVRDVIDGVREWNLTVDKFPEVSVANANKGSTSWLVVLLAVFGSPVAMCFI